jgi:hypothetical protein
MARKLRLRLPLPSVREHLLLAGLLALGVLLRVLLSVWFWPIHGGFLDSSAILEQTEYGIFRDPLRLPGYPFLIRIIEQVAPHVFAIVVVQFLMGLATAVMLYWLVWQATGSKAAGAIPAGYVLLSGDHMVVEHSILGEPTMIFLTTAAITLWVIAARSERLLLWLLPGAALTVAGTVRFGPVVLIAGLAATALLAPGAFRLRAQRTALMFAGALPVLIVWSLAQGESTGRYMPGYSATGWSLYARVAPFADCKRTDVDRDLAFLCADPAPIRHPDVSKRRMGAGWYAYIDGPAVKRFGPPTNSSARGSETLQRFAISVILHQPLDYLRVVTTDMLRYFDRGIGYDRWYSGANSDEEDISRRAQGAAEDVLLETARKTGFTMPDFKVNNKVDMLEDWQRVFRLSGLGLLIVLGLGVAAVIRRGAGRRLAALLLGTGLFYASLPALTQATAYRHSIPVFCFLVAAAAIAIGRWIGTRDDAGSGRPAPSGAPDAAAAS